LTEDPREQSAIVARKLKDCLREEMRAGSNRIIRPRTAQPRAEIPPGEARLETPLAEPGVEIPVEKPAAQPENGMWKALAALERRVKRCTRCELSRTRTNVVYGAGSARVKIVFIGEAPGREEDLQGIPFVGRAGQLLTKIISSIGYRREDVYIANVLKCRPPENRDPTASEVEACSPYLIKQIEIIEPKVICALGLHAAHLLLNTKSSMNKLRGRVQRFRGIKVIPTYHPAACLRYPSFKRQVWEDMQFLKREYERS